MADWKKTLEELAGITGQDRIKTDPADTAPYAVDGVAPRAVLFPKDTGTVAAVVKQACLSGLSVIPWGSGTKTAMGHTPERVDLVVCTARMNHMLDVDTANLTITLEAGVRFRDIQARLATEEDRCYLPLESLTAEAGEFICSDRSHSGCFLPLDPPFSQRATIGGIVATNSSGPRRLLYGLPRDLVLGIRFVTPTGEIVGTGGKTVKNVSGYDISKLMIGSMGSLGILCEMTLRLLPLPESMETLVFTFDTFSDVAGFADALMTTKLLPAALEVANRAALEAVSFQSGLELGPGSYVAMVALEAFQEATARMHKELLVMARHFKAGGNHHFPEDKHRLFWLSVGEIQSASARKHPNLVALRLNYPLSQWKTIFESAERMLSAQGMECTLLCHAGSGVTLVNLLGDSDHVRKDMVMEAVRSLLTECRKGGGNLVVLSAPADWKGSLPIWGEPGPDLQVMKRVRAELDPSGVMNQGRFAAGL